MFEPECVHIRGTTCAASRNSLRAAGEPPFSRSAYFYMGLLSQWLARMPLAPLAWGNCDAPAWHLIRRCHWCSARLARDGWRGASPGGWRIAVRKACWQGIFNRVRHLLDSPWGGLSKRCLGVGLEASMVSRKPLKSYCLGCLPMWRYLGLADHP